MPRGWARKERKGGKAKAESRAHYERRPRVNVEDAPERSDWSKDDALEDMREGHRRIGRDVEEAEVIGALIMTASQPDTDDRARVQAYLGVLDHLRRTNRRKLELPYNPELSWAEQAPMLAAALFERRLAGEISTAEWLETLKGLDSTNSVVIGEAFRIFQDELKRVTDRLDRGEGAGRMLDITPRADTAAKAANGHANGHAVAPAEKPKVTPKWHREKGAAK